jgi:hypothetical protein
MDGNESSFHLLNVGRHLVGENGGLQVDPAASQLVEDRFAASHSLNLVLRSQALLHPKLEGLEIHPR